MQKLLLVFFVIITAVLIGCNKGPEVVTLESGLQYMDDSLGTGREAKADELVSIHFKGWMVPKDTASELFSDWSADQSKSNTFARRFEDEKSTYKIYS
ncbi:MAG: hypothetical protein U5J96_03530 [Ignavibacteriaceae bacterium]|nr:hypothetical protein [Ignavibacteriaceae bacterium]